MSNRALGGETRFGPRVIERVLHLLSFLLPGKRSDGATKGTRHTRDDQSPPPRPVVVDKRTGTHLFLPFFIDNTLLSFCYTEYHEYA